MDYIELLRTCIKEVQILAEESEDIDNYGYKIRINEVISDIVPNLTYDEVFKIIQELKMETDSILIEHLERLGHKPNLINVMKEMIWDKLAEDVMYNC